MTTCAHPSERQYAGWYYDPARGGDYLWVGCTLCGAIITGALDDNGAPTGPQHRLSPKARTRKKQPQAAAESMTV